MDPLEVVTDRMVSRELYAKGVANRVTRQLQDLEIALSGDLAAALARLSAKDEARLLAGNYTTERLKRMVALVSQFSIDWAKIVQSQVESGAIDLIEAEIEFERQYLAAFASDAGLAVTLDATISPRQIFTAAKRRPMQTRLMREVFPDMSRNVKRRVTDSLRVSYQAGDTIGQAMARLRSDPVIGINRRGAEGLVRTALAHYSHSAVKDSLIAMGVQQVQWVSTLDESTTPQCRTLDRQIFDLSNPRTPSAPIHFRCRSTIVPYLGDDMMEGQRASKGADGPKPVSAALDYEQWLRRQPKGFAREVLGATQYKIWSTGVPVTKFTDKYATRVFTAKELKMRYASLFREPLAA